MKFEKGSSRSYSSHVDCSSEEMQLQIRFGDRH